MSGDPRVVLLFVLLAGCAGRGTAVAEPPKAVPEGHVASAWSDAKSQFGRSRLRIRAHEDAVAGTVHGPAIVIAATLLSDDPNVLLAGAPRATVSRRVPESGQGGSDGVPVFDVDDDVGTREVSGDGRTADVLLDGRWGDESPVDLEVRCRVLRVRAWTAARPESVRQDEERSLEAGPFTLDVHGVSSAVIVTVPVSRARPSRPVSAHDVRDLLGARWAAGAVEVRDSLGRRLRAVGEAGHHRAWTVSYSLPDETSEPRIAYPVTVGLAVPEAFDVEYPIFTWRGITLPPPAGAHTIPETTPVPAALPAGYLENDTATRRDLCRDAFETTATNDAPSRRVAAALLVVNLPTVRTFLEGEAERGVPSAREALRAVQSWDDLDEEALARRVAACRSEADLHGLIVGLFSNIDDVGLVRIVAAIEDVGPREALPWLRIRRQLAAALGWGNLEGRLVRDDLVRSLDAALRAAVR